MRRIVEEREAKNVPASQQELDELDLKLRSLRTQLRKAEEASNQFAKQKRELEEKMKKNTNDVSLTLILLSKSDLHGHLQWQTEGELYRSDTIILFECLCLSTKLKEKCLLMRKNSTQVTNFCRWASRTTYF